MSMSRIVTESNAVYLVDGGGFIQRLAEHPMLHRDGQPNALPVRGFIEWWSGPEVGRPLEVILDDGMRFTTTPVKFIDLEVDARFNHPSVL